MTELTLVRGKTDYEGQVGTVRILSDISIDQPEHLARDAFAFAAELLDRQGGAVIDAATDALRELYNDTWRDEDARELDASAFRAALSVDTIRVTDLGNPSFLVGLYLACGDLFAGHMIEVSLERDGQLLGKPHLIG